MIRWVFDTNVVIEHVVGNLTILFATGEGAVSVLTVYEALRLPGLSVTEEESLRIFFDTCEVLDVAQSIARRAAALGRIRKTKSFDLLIAATAIECDATLVTKNLRDFRNIPSLRVSSKLE